MGFGFVIVLAFKKDLLLFLITSIPGGGEEGCEAAGRARVTGGCDPLFVSLITEF